MEDLEHVDEAGQPLGLRGVARQAVEHQGVLLGHDQLLHLQDVQVPLEDPHGEVVGDHQALRGVLLDLAAELAVAGDLAEHVAHRDVDEAGELAQDGPLRPLAAARHPEQEDGTIPVTLFHDRSPPCTAEAVRERCGRPGTSRHADPDARRRKAASRIESN